MFVVALCVASMAAPPATGSAPASNAPASLAGHVMQAHISQANDVYSRFAGRDFLTTFTVDGHYITEELNGAVSDGGTYSYTVTGANTSEIVYHVGTQSLVQTGGDYTEQYLFQTPTSGTFTAVASTEAASYKGTFSIK